MYLQLDTKFNPFTYDEMIKPLLYYKQSYDEAEAAYADLSQQTEMWKNIADREKSPEAFEMYQRYSGDLNNAVNDFSKGMTARNKRALLGLKRRYAQEITPISQAYDAMKAANEFRLKAGPDAIFKVGEYTSLDDFLHGKTANNDYQSKEALTKKTATLIASAMNEALKDPEFKKVMGDQFWEITQHTGGSYEELLDAFKLGMADNPIAQNKFSEIRQKVAKEAGIEDYDTKGQLAIMDAIDSGLYAGLDKPIRNFQANADHETPYQKQMIGLQNSQLALSAAQSGFIKNDKGNWEYHAEKDPTFIKALGKSGGSGDKGGASIPSKPFFYDIKNPEKSTFMTNYDQVSGIPANFIELGEGDEYKDINETVKKKTKGKYNTLKDAIIGGLKNMYPNMTEAEIPNFIDKYLIIQYDDNGNIYYSPKQYISKVSMENGSIYDGVDAGSVLPAGFMATDSIK